LPLVNFLSNLILELQLIKQVLFQIYLSFSMFSLLFALIDSASNVGHLFVIEFSRNFLLRDVSAPLSNFRPLKNSIKACKKLTTLMMMMMMMFTKPPSNYGQRGMTTKTRSAMVPTLRDVVVGVREWRE
ncbi:hypothetical protein L9F63_018715, partial [Diploptera punctata]